MPYHSADDEARVLDKINSLTQRIIGCAIEVHGELGPGLFESVYERALAIELGDKNLRYQRQMEVAALYKGRVLGSYRIDFVVEETVLIEVKSVSPNRAGTHGAGADLSQDDRLETGTLVQLQFRSVGGRNPAIRHLKYWILCAAAPLWFIFGWYPSSRGTER